MKIILAVLLFTLPALAATDYATSNIVDGIQATLTVQNDTIHFSNLYGSKWGTVRWRVLVADAGGITAQYSKDYGANWLTPPYSVNISATSSNPSTAPWANNTPVAGIYETPLPGDTTDFRILYATASTGATIALMPGKPYVPGVPVVATLADVTEGSIGAGVATMVYDISGWRSAYMRFTTPTGQVWTVFSVDDAGVGLNPSFGTTAATNSSAVISDSISANPTAAALAAGVIGSFPMADKRISVALPAGGSVTTGRVRIVVRR